MWTPLIACYGGYQLSICVPVCELCWNVGACCCWRDRDSKAKQVYHCSFQQDYREQMCQNNPAAYLRSCPTVQVSIFSLLSSLLQLLLSCLSLIYPPSKNSLFSLRRKRVRLSDDSVAAALKRTIGKTDRYMRLDTSVDAASYKNVESSDDDVQWFVVMFDYELVRVEVASYLRELEECDNVEVVMDIDTEHVSRDGELDSFPWVYSMPLSLANIR